MIFATVLARIPIYGEKTPDKKELAIFLLSNGVHTDIVLPVKTNKFDWEKYIPTKNIKQNDSIFKYLAFGWGDKGFYLETPSWGELKPSTAFNASFGLSTSAIHTTYYTKMSENKTNCVKVLLTQKQYENLCSYVKNSFVMAENNEFKFIHTKAIYGNHDAFYDASGNYSLFQTCNTWTNNALKSCGQKASFWTAFQDGIFYHYQ